VNEKTTSIRKTDTSNQFFKPAIVISQQPEKVTNHLKSALGAE